MGQKFKAGMKQSHCIL